MVRFTFRQIEYALAVDQYGGIAQAARRLNISQPSVAQGLEKLEAVTGLVLFERHHARGVTVTSQGRQFLGYASGLLDNARQVERDAAALSAYQAGELRLGCFATIAAFYLPALIRSFNEVHPSIRVSAEEATLDALAERVRQGELDVCLTYDIGESLEGLEVRPLAMIRPKVLLAASHPMAGKDSIALGDLTDEPYVIYDAPGSREYFAALLQEAGLTPKIAYASQTLEGVRSAVGAGFGFSIVALRPGHDVTYEGKQVSALAIEDDLEQLSIVAASRRTGVPNRMLLQFVEHAAHQLAKAGRPLPSELCTEA